MQDKHKLGGTVLYASVNKHLGIGTSEAICRRFVTNCALAQSRRDDLESLGYMIYFCCGSLPWQGLKAATEDARNVLVKEKKMNNSIENLCRGLPDAFTSYFKHVQTLKLTTGPTTPTFATSSAICSSRKGFSTIKCLTGL